MSTSKPAVRHILLFGPQGSGKGTQGEKLSQWLGLPLIVTGNIFREHMKSDTELGQLAKQYINHGQLVPDQVTNQMIGQRLQAADCTVGFIIDGFPRSLIQAQAMDQFAPVTHLLHIAISDQIAVKRIAERRTCSAQGHVYHLTYKPPRQTNTCDSDGSPLQQRDDDTETALRKRLEIYHQATEPVVQHYQQQGVVYTINGEQSIAQVWQDIQAIFQALWLS